MIELQSVLYRLIGINRRGPIVSNSLHKNIIRLTLLFSIFSTFYSFLQLFFLITQTTLLYYSSKQKYP